MKSNGNSRSGSFSKRSLDRGYVRFMLCFSRIRGVRKGKDDWCRKTYVRNETRVFCHNVRLSCITSFVDLFKVGKRNSYHVRIAMILLHCGVDESHHFDHRKLNAQAQGPHRSLAQTTQVRFLICTFPPSYASSSKNKSIARVTQALK